MTAIEYARKYRNRPSPDFPMHQKRSWRSMNQNSAQRQREGERRAASHLTLAPDPPAVQLDEFLRDGEAESRALNFFRNRPHLAELLEHRILVFRSNSDPGVRD